MFKGKKKERAEIPEESPDAKEARLRAELKDEIIAELRGDKDVEKKPGKSREEEGTGAGVVQGEAALKLINFMFDPDDAHLPMITRVERRAVLPLSIQIMREAITDPERIRKGTPLSSIWRIAYFKLQRSVDMRGFLIAAGLAHEQAQAEEEKAEEEEW